MEVVIKGARIHYERSGCGFPLLLIHAGIADSRMWEPQAKAFAHEFDMIRPDLRGMGESELRPGSYSLRSDMIGLLDLLGVARAHVVGCSLGGSLALDIAIEHPERVAKLVLVGSGISGAAFGAADDALFIEIEAADKAGDTDATNRAEIRLWVDGPRRPEGSAPPDVRALAIDMNARGFRTDWSIAKHDALDPPALGRLGEVRAPTLIIVGDQDLPHVSVAADALKSGLHDSRTVVIENAAHLPSLERPEEFNRILREFLAEA